MKKKCLSCLFAAMLLFAAVIPGIALADFNYDVIGTPHIIVIDASDLSAASPVYERAADEQIYPASTTKMLTCLLALEHSSPDAEVTVGEEIRGFFETKKGYTTGPSGSSLMGLVVGETVTMRDLMYGLMLSSGNDAADAIAVAIGGTIQDFVSMMNEKAAEIGMTGSHFTNPNGVHNDNHYSTARDMAKLAAYAMNNQTFAEIVRTPAYTVPSNSTRQQDLNLINSNFLLTSLGSSNYSSYPYEYCIGIKTGMTPKSGYCLVAAAEKSVSCKQSRFSSTCLLETPKTWRCRSSSQCFRSIRNWSIRALPSALPVSSRRRQESSNRPLDSSAVWIPCAFRRERVRNR